MLAGLVVTLLGLAAAAEDDLASRKSHADLEGEHDHDDFETVALPVRPAVTAGDLAARVEAAAEANKNGHLYIVRRDNGQEVGFFGHYGKQVGQFHNIHQIVSDSKGNIYTGEVDVGMRIQKFTPNMAPAK